MTRVIAVSGYKKSGKTTLCGKLIEELKRLGVRTGYIKRTSEDVSPDSSTDTGSVAAAGTCALLWGSGGVRLEMSAEEQNALSLAARFFPDAEIVIMEGGKNIDLPKVWVRSEGEKIPCFPGIFLVYDRFRDGVEDSTFGRGCESALAARLASLVSGPAYRSSEVYIGDRELPMKDFVADFVRGGVLGMISSLKGGKTNGEAVRVYIKGNPEK